MAARRQIYGIFFKRNKDTFHIPTDRPIQFEALIRQLDLYGQILRKDPFDFNKIMFRATCIKQLAGSKQVNTTLKI